MAKKKKKNEPIVPFFLGSLVGMAIYHAIIYPKRFVQDYNSRNWGNRIENY